MRGSAADLGRGAPLCREHYAILEGGPTMSQSRVYTRTGDDGQTGLFGGPRVAKDDPRLEAYGTVDELNSAIGIAVASLGHADLETRLQVVQSDLFDIGGELATPDIEERIARG